jgi:hypothetical protein
MGGEWVGEAAAQLGAQVLCGSCYDVAKAQFLSESS